MAVREREWTDGGTRTLDGPGENVDPADAGHHQRGLTDQIDQLDAQGKVLSNPDVRDGPPAQQFRDQTWPETKTAPDKTEVELDQLRGRLQKIAQNIMTAGGGY
jgi:hypothetical protein